MIRTVAHAPDAPPPRPLYVAPSGTAHLTLDGPALCIELPDRQPVYVPLRRLSRIHLAGNVTFEGEVVLACARRGIVFVVHDEEEEPVARIVGRSTELTRFRQRLNDLAANPEWRDRYGDWKRSMEMRICGILRHRLNAPWALKNRPELMRRWIQARITAAVGAEEAGRTRRIFRQAAVGWMQTRLLAKGVGAENELWLAGEPDLALDLGHLLAFRLETRRTGWLEARARAANGSPVRRLSRKAIVARFEKKSGQVEKLGDDLINRLHRWLVEIA